MPHEETITPALTPEQWATVLHPRSQWDEPLEAFVYAGHGGEIGVSNAHAAAAVLLHGEPFGFTREDVVALRAFDFQFWGNDEDSVLVRRADCEALHRLASRIAALLPPEDATP